MVILDLSSPRFRFWRRTNQRLPKSWHPSHKRKR